MFVHCMHACMHACRLHATRTETHPNHLHTIGQVTRRTRALLCHIQSCTFRIGPTVNEVNEVRGIRQREAEASGPQEVLFSKNCFPHDTWLRLVNMSRGQPRPIFVGAWTFLWRPLTDGGASAIYIFTLSTVQKETLCKACTYKT